MITKKDSIEVPRWTILLLDQAIVVSLFIVSYFSIRQFDLQRIFLGHVLNYTLLYCFISLTVFYFLKIHTGLIRYSNLHDLVKIMKALLITGFIFGAMVEGYWFIRFDTLSQNVPAILFFNFFISSAALMMARLALKEVFYFARATALGINQTNVLIIGTSQSAVLLKHAIDSNNPNNYFVAGFLSNSSSRKNNFIEQKPVFQFAEIEEAKYKLHVKKIIVTTDLLSYKIVTQLIEEAIRLEIPVVTVPAPADWISGTLRKHQLQDLRIEDLLYRKPIILENDMVTSLCRGKRILVTGAAGSIGSEIVRQVLKLDPDMVILFDQAETPLHEFSLEVLENFPKEKIRTFIGDIRNYKRSLEVFSTYKPEIVFHAAAYKHVPLMEENPSEAVLTNILGTKNMADLAISFKAERFIMISSDKAVNPANVMGASKRIAEIYIQALQHKETALSRESNTNFIITRFGNVLGSNGSVIPRFNAQIKMGGPITVTHPEITRFFMTIPEAVTLVLEAATMGRGKEIYVFDMGKPVKIKDLAIKMIELSGLRPFTDIDIVYTGLRPGEKLYEELLSDTELTMPTHHPLIKIANRGIIPSEDSVEKINALISFAHFGAIDNLTLVQKMKTIAGEFVSKNSPFELLDIHVA